jgi:phosphate transport system ATP-binding protein
VIPEEPAVVAYDPQMSAPSALPDTGSVSTFPGGAVVQLVSGDPHADDALVVELHGATIAVDARGVSAVDGDFEWSWLAADLQDVIHGGEQPWSILVVPDIPDFGVSLDPAHVADFRRAIASLRGEVPVDEPEAPAPPGVLLDTPTVVDAPVLLPPPIVPITEPVALTAAAAVTDPEDMPAAAGATAKKASLRDRLKSQHQAHVDALARNAPLTGIDARSISAWFGNHKVLDRVSLDMKAGEVTALIGPSGCGKSTFLRILNRMHEMIPGASMGGEVILDGHDIYDPNRKLTDARREIGMVFQKPNPFPAMSIYDNVVASLRLTGTKASQDVKDELVESCLLKAGLWNEVKDRLRQPGGGLSGGQQQRLCIARALAIKPRVLLMDEPCSALDPTSTRRIEETIMELVSEVTIVIVTHNMQQAARVSDQCAFFLAEQGTPGVIVEHGPTQAMFGNPQDPRTDDYVNGRFG